jgi:hypothetical protein
LVALTSSYDSFIGDLLGIIIEKRPEIIQSSEKQLTMRQILAFASMDEAKSYVKKSIADEIMRDSRLQQIEWIRNRLNIKFDFSDPIFNEFAEICERRNLFTHTGGRATKQYIENCSKANVDVSNVKIDDQLEVDGKYLRRAIDVYYEVGVKLGIIVWRQLESEHNSMAESFLADVGYNLILNKIYKLAQKMLEFGVKMPSISKDRTKKLYIINLANAYKLDGSTDKATDELAKIDWSSVGLDFQICVAAIRDDVKMVAKLIRRIGPKGDVDRENYIEWPVFQTVRNLPEFRQAYQEVFSIPFEQDAITIEANKVAKSNLSKKGEDEDEEDGENENKAIESPTPAPLPSRACPQ